MGTAAPLAASRRRGHTLMSELDWCLDAVARWSGGACKPVSFAPIHSRVAVLHLLTVTIDGAERRFYVKQYAAAELAPGDLARRFTDLQAIAAAIGQREGLRPYVAVACDPERRLLLTAETAGRPLGRIQRRIPWSAGSRRDALAAWNRVGAWLDALHWHSLDPRLSQSRSEDLVAYTLQRLAWWREDDRTRRDACAEAEEAVQLIGSSLGRSPVLLVPCHGDVTMFNILINGSVGLVDFDDFRFDLPGGDVSQALLELDQFSTVGSVARLDGFYALARQSFLEGYPHPLPSGGEMWLPHLRNLAVRVVTLARRRRGLSASRLSNAWHYRNAVNQLSRAARSVIASNASADYFLRA